MCARACARANVRACVRACVRVHGAYMHTPLFCIPYITMHSITETYVLLIIYIPQTYPNILLSS